MNNRLNGGLTHGILTMLNLAGPDGARAMDITNAFPTLDGSSTLTFMRRKGLIEKASAMAVEPRAWVITAEGQALLATLEQYTPATYWDKVWGIGRWNTMTAAGFRGKNLDVKKFGWEQPAYMSERHYGVRC